MEQVVTVQVRSVYGNELVYPACRHAVLFAEIAGTKTLSESVLRRIRALGYEIRVESPAVVFAL